MSAKWPMVKLGEVLQPVSRVEIVDPAKEYRLLGVRLDGQGPFLREIVPGSETAATRLYRVESGDFIYSRLFAWRGAFGVIEQRLDGCFVSGEFPTFRPDLTQLQAHFLRYWFRLPSTLVAVEQDCSGSTPLTHNRFKEEFFLALEIPLPPLSEQQRIVARIEKLVAHIEEARRLRREAIEEAEALVSSAFSALSHSEVVERHSVEGFVGKDGLRNGRSVKPTGVESGIRCLTLSAMRNGRIDVRDSKPVPMSATEAQPFQVRTGDVYVIRGNGSKDLCGRAGPITEEAAGVIFPDLFIQVALSKERVLPEFFVAAWNSSATRAVIEEKAKTTSGIWKINQGHILSTLIPVPPLPDQRRIVAELEALQAEVDRLKALQAKTAAEVDALLPAILDRAFKGKL